MRMFHVTVRYERPFPASKEYREKAGKIEVAISRALRLFRATESKGKPIKRITVSAYLIGPTAE